MRTLLFVGIIFLSNLVTAQGEWAPLGAKWTYGIGYVSDASVTYNEWQVTGDTLIQGQLCSVTERIGHEVVGDNSAILITYESEGIVYWLVDDSFSVMYDFNKEVGETYIMQLPDCNLEVHIDATDTEIVNGMELKVQHVSAEDPMYYTGTIMEKVGHLTRPHPYMAEACGTGLFDYNYYSELRCYEDESFDSHFFTPIEDCYAQTLGVKDEARNLAFEVYPNPAQGRIQIELEVAEQGQFSLLDISGRKVLAGELGMAQKHTVDVSGLKAGIYLLRVETNGRVGVEKLRLY